MNLVLLPPIGSLVCMPQQYTSTHKKIEYKNIVLWPQEKIEAILARIDLEI